ncbi:oxidoreductase domain-containing protein [Lasiosphaeria miniovina]|uniref:D-xylose 1-dehydrogenase (NADP(+), D-xylono-1,5-lactone-forming) n=1 Tax=Lasiosphaeria miniovina TaxID=1954250 RepID=A0AA40DV90_9PEZI|nr:oxidoreductase domain-containing protein [Lasiosphaeria miniovina]KAK0717634.1 oxidoreductase domain-containing protein [Lasiosphaeria miniovina]
MFGMLSRIYTAIAPPTVEKSKDGAIRFGILGAAKIAPMAIVVPAKSHPEVVVHAISARDRGRAEEFAKKHGIPVVRDTYQEILDDPDIDAVFIPLPNSLHYEWAVRSVRAGKHVLLEKPSVDTAAEAEILFGLSQLASSQPSPPIILEAFHNRFHPAVQKFLSLVSPADVAHVHTDSMVPWWLTARDNIEFNYALGGGSMMMLGTYNFALLRMIFAAEPAECVSCETRGFGDGVHDKCDTSFRAQFRFPNGGTADAMSTMRGSVWWKPSEARVTHREVVVPNDGDGKADPLHETVRTRVVTLHGFVQAIAWHRIDVKDTFVLRAKADGRTLRTWTEASSHKAYTYAEAGPEFADAAPGEPWWMSYRWQLEEFVNRVKGRPTQFWISGEDSINQMRMLDMAYEKSGLGLRPMSEFR